MRAKSSTRSLSGRIADGRERDRISAREAAAAYLVVGQVQAEDVSQEEDDLVLRVLALGRRHIALNAPDLLEGACSRPCHRLYRRQIDLISYLRVLLRGGRLQARELAPKPAIVEGAGHTLCALCAEAHGGCSLGCGERVGISRRPRPCSYIAGGKFVEAEH